ncbi:phospholipase A2-like [Pectinophora gossypiella]|uniref:phospholipase A2-like n=1 Tax=Pectinophora gossypiella TaxID=13191 RepID=UPI00214E4E48|nr:phospholipase A2-like [Pectinophora gossypiella]
MGEDIDEIIMQERINLIFPGTKWCGAGNIADGDEDLGPSKDTDRCCRDHDHCPDIIPAGETKHNLTNTAFYTRLSCECDETFRQCLRNVDSSTSRVVGKMYFNTIGTKCFKNAYPVTGCVHKGGWFNTKCLEYSFDESGEKRYQWFDVPNY